jgi:hypothetical protein
VSGEGDSRILLGKTSGLRKFRNLGVKWIQLPSFPVNDNAKQAAEMQFAKIRTENGKPRSNIMTGFHFLKQRPPDYGKAKASFRKA